MRTPISPWRDHHIIKTAMSEVRIVESVTLASGAVRKPCSFFKTVKMAYKIFKPSKDITYARKSSRLLQNMEFKGIYSE